MAWTHHFNGEKILLLKPLTYMNLSGRALGEAVRYFSLSWEEDVLVIYDDTAANKDALGFADMDGLTDLSSGGFTWAVPSTGWFYFARAPE